MDSVRYHSYHQWKASKADTNKPSTYHQKLLTNVEALEGNVNQIDKLIAGYLDATKAFCGAGSQLAEAFSTVLNETPLLELPQQLKQVVEEVDHVAHKSSVHITNHILATLCEFTATMPGVRRTIEAHKRSVQNYESCQENLELLEKDSSLASEGRMKTTTDRFRSATEELATEEERLYRSFTEVEENRVKMLGSCFLSLLQVQSQFMSSAADLMSPLGGFQEIGDYLRDREVTLALKDATSTWLSLAQANQALRQRQGLSRQDIKHLTWGELCDSEKKKLVHCVETLLKKYKKEFERAPTPTADIPAGFHKNPKGIELALQGCCIELECVAAGGLVDAQSHDEMEVQILRKIPKLSLKIGYVFTETCQSPSKVNDNFKSKLHCIRDLVSSVAKQNDIPLNKGNLDMFVLMVLHETCSPIASSTAQIAVQLLFGTANLVTVKPSSENCIRQAHVYTKGTSVHVDVSTAWIITEDKTTFASIASDLDTSSPLGTVDAVYTAKFSLMDYLEEKERPLPSINIKRRAQPQSPQTLFGKEASHAHKHKGFRKSLSKATSKIFSRKSSNHKVGSGNAAAVSDVNNPDEPVSGAGAGNELAGVRTSVASSTDTSNDHEADPNFESPVPLPPPRPKHWARKVSTNNMNNITKDAVQEDCKETKASDEWYNSEPKLPLPLFKPTMQGADSFLSLASQEELDEVINFLSGAPLSLSTCAEDKCAEGSHLTPIDSGMGSLLSVPTSNISLASNATLSVANVNGIAMRTPVVQVHISAVRSETSTETTKAGTQASTQATNDSAQSPERDTGESQTSPAEALAPVSFDCEPNGVGTTQDISSEPESPKKGEICILEAYSADISPDEEQNQTEMPSDYAVTSSKVTGDSGSDVQAAATSEKTTGDNSSDVQATATSEKTTGESSSDVQAAATSEKTTRDSSSDVQGAATREKTTGDSSCDVQAAATSEKTTGADSSSDVQAAATSEKTTGADSSSDLQAAATREKTTGDSSCDVQAAATSEETSRADNSNDLQAAATSEETTENGIVRKKETSSPSLDPVVVTVTSAEDCDIKRVSIVDSLRNVWLKAEPKSFERTTEELPGKLKDRTGSHETLYHSCWSLSDFSERPANNEDDQEDTKSLNEVILQSNTGTEPLDLGLKWSNFGSNPVWDSNSNTKVVESGCWQRSDEALNSRAVEGGRNDAFSLGLGITGPELFAAARGTSLDAIPSDSGPQLRMDHKPWSTEDLSQKDPWSSRQLSHPVPWNKDHSLSLDAHKPAQARVQSHPPFLPQQRSEPFLPNERWWSPAGAPPPAMPHVHPVYPRYHSHLQRQYAMDNTYQGMPAGAHMVHGGVYFQSAVQPVHQVYAKTPNQGRQLQVPPQYGLGHVNHHASNPRF